MSRPKFYVLFLEECCATYLYLIRSCLHQVNQGYLLFVKEIDLSHFHFLGATVFYKEIGNEDYLVDVSIPYQFVQAILSDKNQDIIGLLPDCVSGSNLK
jgi:hypothetical protein